MRALFLSAALVAALAGSAFAQGAGQGGVTPAQSNKVVSTLADMFGACGEIAEEYRPDCIAQALLRGAQKIANNPGYWEAHVALTRAGRRLTQLVREHTDPDADRVRVRGYRLRAVAAAAMPELRRVGEETMMRAERDLEAVLPYEREAFAPIADVIRTERPWP